ncbi:MAG TPA: Lrp/AsnC family transcriptional regulator [Solirubrobacterales bacterium]|nr:Lrp/AsnC family transcriptional regulator [Solirubrobacterales bacterium]
MALSDDQKAILRLLAQRGEQGYDDLSALMGISVEEVHARAKQAAAELEDEGIPAPAIPEPGGEGDSPSVANFREAPPGESPSPKASKPRARSQEPKPIPPRPKVHSAKEAAHELKLLEKRGLWAVLAGVAIVVLFVVILFVGGGGDSGSDSTTTASEGNDATAALEQAASKQGKEVTKAVLNPVDGSEATGVAVFGRVKDKLALQVFAQGLEQTDAGESYTIWLAATPEKMLPLASTEVKDDGKISAQVEVPTEILAYLATETFGQIAVTKTEESELKASLARATKAKEAPDYTGTEVLRGTVTGPIVGAAGEKEDE